jgi:dolichol-phosphate mannosyltransferase
MDNDPDERFDMKISVVIPTRNEEGMIKEIIEGCRPYADELMVVDGHSTDKTREIAEAAGVKVILDNGKGKGAALRYAATVVTGDIIVFIDADGSHDPRDIPKLVEPILKGEADHVSGSRLIGGSSELHGGFDECFRLMGSSFITACINWRFKVILSESQNGFRAIKTDVIRQLGLEENITTIEQEMIMKTLKKGFRMAEVPTHEHKRKMGYSKISLKKVWFRYVYSMVKYLLF